MMPMSISNQQHFDIDLQAPRNSATDVYKIQGLAQTAARTTNNINSTSLPANNFFLSSMKSG